MSINKTDSKIKTSGIILGELLALGTIVFLIANKQYSRLPLAFGTLGLVLLPEIMEKLFCYQYRSLKEEKKVQYIKRVLELNE